VTNSDDLVTANGRIQASYSAARIVGPLVAGVIAAIKNKIELSVNIAMSSTLQISLFVAPVLVLLGFFIDKPLDLVFNTFEVVAVVVTMLIASAIVQDGESNWFEGFQLLATYGILAVAFFFHP
jgi:Ca2+:H+ antiporter